MKKNQHTGHVAGNFVTRKSGNSLSLTVPSDAGIPEGKEYVLTIMEDGTLAYRPQRQNPWHTSAAKDYDFRSDLHKINFSEEKRMGREL